jgi:heme-degrading monooxygenase HmoA
MYAVIFEVEPKEGRIDDYLRFAADLKPELEKIDGFISIERFRSLSREGKILSLSFWRDEEAIRRWRGHERHRLAQRAGRGDIFADYRIRVAAVIRDYGMLERNEAPQPAPEAEEQRPFPFPTNDRAAGSKANPQTDTNKETVSASPASPTRGAGGVPALPGRE